MLDSIRDASCASPGRLFVGPSGLYTIWRGTSGCALSVASPMSLKSDTCIYQVQLKLQEQLHIYIPSSYPLHPLRSVPRLPII